MDVKVYKKEEVLQPSGSEEVYVPDVIDIIPQFAEVEDTDISGGLWDLTDIQDIADISIENDMLVFNSELIGFENNNLVVHNTDNVLSSCETVEGKELVEQQCALATIFQKGLDPLDLDDGIRWSEAILEEISCLQLIQDIIEAVEKVTTSVVVTFDTIEDAEGNSFLSYKLSEVA